MSYFNIHSPFELSGDQPKAVESIVNGLNSNEKYQVLLGITGSGKTFTMANVIQQVQRPTLILSHNKTLAAQLYGEFKSLFPENAVEFFISYYDYYQPEAYIPVTDTFIEKDSSVNEEIDRLRLKATTSLISRRDVIIIASVSCIYGIGSPEEYKNLLVHISKGETIDVKGFLKQLVNIHYVRNDLILEPGTFRVRGDVIEVFPVYDEEAVRIELFGDEVETISFFHPLTGEVIRTQEELHIYPAKHFVTSEENLKRSMNDIRVELSDRLKELRAGGALLEAQRLEQRTLYDLEMMTELGYCSGIENYSRHLDGRKVGERPSTLLDFFPDDFIMIIDESHVSLPQIRAMYNGDKARKDTLVEHGFRLPSALDNRPMKFHEFEEKVDQQIFVSATPSEYELEKTGGAIIEQIIRPTGLLDPSIRLKPTKGQVDDLIGEVKKVIAREERVLVTTLTKRMSEDLTDFLKGVGIKAEYMHSGIDTIERVKILRGLRLKEFDVLVGINLLREGLDLPEVSLVAVLDADKEGFLRSKSSLMQVAGRAARNVNGQVILYGDKVTKSMQHLIDETNKRRKLQEEYNLENNINPQTIYKSVDDIKLTTAVADEKETYIVEEIPKIDFNSLEEIELKDMIKQLERKMLKYARNLQFEDAAILRDQIDQVKTEYGKL